MHGAEAEATWRNPPCTAQRRADNYHERLLYWDIRLVAFAMPYSIRKTTISRVQRYPVFVLSPERDTI